jgi:hypothetical protein
MGYYMSIYIAHVYVEARYMQPIELYRTARNGIQLVLVLVSPRTRARAKA